MLNKLANMSLQFNVNIVFLKPASVLLIVGNVVLMVIGKGCIFNQYFEV